MARGEDAFTAADSLCRLQRLQATCGALRESEGVDALLFVGGVDGRDNLGSVRCLNFLLGGVGGVELLEREQCVGKWGEDVVLLVRPDGCEIHVGHAHYEALRPFIAAWGNVDVHTLPPRHIPNEDDEAPKRPDREDEARDDDEASSDESLGGRGDGSDDSEEEEEEEDVLQDFKLTALVSMLTGATTVGVACTPNGPGEMETERWPLLQAYGIEGVGRSGFFTMSTKVVDTWDVIHRACFTQLDGAQLRRELARSTPPFRQHWEASIGTMDARRAPGRMTLTPALAFDPLTEFFAYGTLRRPVGFGAFDDAMDAPSVRFGLGTDADVCGKSSRRKSRKRQGVRVGARARPRAALHGRGEAPEEPGASMREDLRVWPGMRDRNDHQRLHQTRRRRRRLRKPIATEKRAAPRHRRGGRRRARGTLRRRGRRGPRRHVRRVRRVGRRLGPRDVDDRRECRRRQLCRRRETSVCKNSGCRPRRPIARRVGSRVDAGRPRGRDGPVERARAPSPVAASLDVWRTFASLSAASSASRAASPSARSCTATRSSPAVFEPAKKNPAGMRAR